MILGISPSDFVTLPQFAWRVYNVLKDAPGAHKALSQEVLSLQQILVKVEAKINKKTRNLVQEDLEQLSEIFQGCKDVLEEVESMLHVYKMDEPGVSFGRIKFATKDLALIRSRIAAQVDRLNAFNGFLMVSSQDRTERKLDKVIAVLKRRGSVISIESMASVLHKKQGWETFGRALEDEGITLKMVQERHSFVVRLLAAAVDRAEASDKAANDEVAVKFASFSPQSTVQAPKDARAENLVDSPPASKQNIDEKLNPDNFDDPSKNVAHRNSRHKQFPEIEPLVDGPEIFKPRTDRSSMASRTSSGTLFVSRNRLDSASFQAAIEIVAGTRSTGTHSAQAHGKDHTPATIRMSVQYNPIDFKNVLKQHPAHNFGNTMYGQAQQMALHFAALFGVVEILMILLHSDSRPDARTISGKIPLHIAVYGDHTKIVQRLLRNNIGMSFRDLRVWLLSQSATQHLANTVQIPCICPDIISPLDISHQLVKGEVNCGSPSCVGLKEKAKINTLPAPQSSKIATDWLAGNGEDLSSLCESSPDSISTVINAISHVLDYWHDQGICRILKARFPQSQSLLRDVVSNGKQRLQRLVHRSRHRTGGHAGHHEACDRCLSLTKHMKSSILQTCSVDRRESFLRDAAMNHGQTALTMALNSYSSLLLDELVGHGYNEIAGRKIREELGI